MNDGTCEYARDKFFGIYNGTSVCTEYNSWDGGYIHFTISQDANDVNNVRMLFSHPIQPPGMIGESFMIWTATVEGSTLIVDATAPAPTLNQPICGTRTGTGGMVKLTASATLTDNQLRFTEFYFSARQDDELLCFHSCEIVAEKN